VYSTLRGSLARPLLVCLAPARLVLFLLRPATELLRLVFLWWELLLLMLLPSRLYACRKGHRFSNTITYEIVSKKGLPSPVTWIRSAVAILYRSISLLLPLCNRYHFHLASSSVGWLVDSCKLFAVFSSAWAVLNIV
jgi:hypothetical protein